MKKILLLASIIMPVLLFAQTPSYHITVKLPRAKAGTHAWLVESFGWSNQRILDSAVLNKGKLVFKGATGNVIKAHIVVDHAGQGIPISEKKADALLVYLDSTAMTVAGKDSVHYAMVTGSALNKEYIHYYKQVLAPAEKVGDNINTAYRQATPAQQGNAAFRDSLMAYIQHAWVERDSLKRIYIRQHPNSFLSLEALTEVAGKDIDVPAIEPIFAVFSPAVRNSRLGLSFAKKLYDKGPTSIGEMAPDFAQPDAQGKLVKLSDYKGQYVLIDFWASWCGPCRAENPNVLKAYHAFKDKSFTVLGVSLDETKKRDAWLQAVEKDALPWTQVSDLKGWNNEAAVLYGVQAIPQNYLIDPTGKIVAKNLRGAALEAKLQEILGGK